MPSVVLGRDLARRFTAGETRLNVSGDPRTVREVIAALDQRYPGLGVELRTGMAVAIDGLVFQDALLQDVTADAELCFMPAIEGG